MKCSEVRERLYTAQADNKRLREMTQSQGKLISALIRKAGGYVKIDPGELDRHAGWSIIEDAEGKVVLTTQKALLTKEAQNIIQN